MANEKVSYWTEIAAYDLETAEAMLQSKRLIYVGFMCHQAVAKLLKACYVVSTGENPPYIHNLATVAQKADVYDSLSDDQLALLDILQPLNN